MTACVLAFGRVATILEGPLFRRFWRNLASSLLRNRNLLVNLNSAVDFKRLLIHPTSRLKSLSRSSRFPRSNRIFVHSDCRSTSASILVWPESPIIGSELTIEHSRELILACLDQGTETHRLPVVPRYAGSNTY